MRGLLQSQPPILSGILAGSGRWQWSAESVTHLTERCFELFYWVSDAGLAQSSANPRLGPDRMAYWVNYAGGNRAGGRVARDWTSRNGMP